MCFSKFSPLPGNERAAGACLAFFVLLRQIMQSLYIVKVLLSALL